MDGPAPPFKAGVPSARPLSTRTVLPRRVRAHEADPLEFVEKRMRIRLSGTSPDSRLKLHVASYLRWRARLAGEVLPITIVPVIGAGYPILMEVPARDGELQFFYVYRALDWLGLLVTLRAVPGFLGLPVHERAPGRGPLTRLSQALGSFVAASYEGPRRGGGWIRALAGGADLGSEDLRPAVERQQFLTFDSGAAPRREGARRETKAVRAPRARRVHRAALPPRLRLPAGDAAVLSPVRRGRLRAHHQHADAGVEALEVLLSNYCPQVLAALLWGIELCHVRRLERPLPEPSA